MTKTPQQPLPSEMVESLLQTVKRRQQQGDSVGARVVLRALAMQQDDARLWLALAGMAATRDEQIDALQHALSVEPSNPIANQALQRLQADADLRAASSASDSLTAVIAPQAATADTAPIPTPEAASDVAPTEQIAALDSSQQATAPMPVADAALAPTAPMPAMSHAPTLRPLDTSAADESQVLSDAERAKQIRWPLYLLAAVAVVLLACALLWALNGRSGSEPNLQPTPSLPGAVIVAPSDTPEPSATDTASATASPSQTNTPAEPTATATITPSPTPSTLSAGNIVREGDWQATLLRPEHMLVLEGAIGSLQPKGYFVLALMAVSNASGQDSAIPTSLFSLRDTQDLEYPAIPSASQAFLDVYGRGQRGDLSMIEPIPGNGGLVSVPLIFDIPNRSGKYTLYMGDAPTGWPLSITNNIPQAPTLTVLVP